MKVSNMRSARGNPIANQFIVETPNGRYFQSYGSTIAKIDMRGCVYLDSKYWDYSTTTGKYRNQFLGENIANTRKKIASGVYKLVDLNSGSY